MAGQQDRSGPSEKDTSQECDLTQKDADWWD